MKLPRMLVVMVALAAIALTACIEEAVVTWLQTRGSSKRR